jgi:hypothetical protein
MTIGITGTGIAGAGNTGPDGLGIGGFGGIIGLGGSIIVFWGNELNIGNNGNGHVNGYDVGVGIPLIMATFV